MMCTLLRIVLIGLVFVSPALAADYIITSNMETVDQHTFTPKPGAGDRLLIPGGITRGMLAIKNLSGEKGRPLTVMNSGTGQATIDADDWAGLRFLNCEYIKLTGTGDPGTKYGIKIKDATSHGLFITDKSKYFEVEKIEIDNCHIGITAKTPKYDATRGDWYLDDLHIHDTWIHNIGHEGMYIGNTDWSTDVDPELRGVVIDNNLVENCGWEGIQLCSAPYGTGNIISNNTVKNCGASNDPGRDQPDNKSLVLGSGGKASVFNNWIENSGGFGIFINDEYGKSTYRSQIFNNVIIRSGRSAELTGKRIGIRVSTGNNIDIYHNTIVSSPEEAIKISNNATGGTIKYNLIAGFGSGDGIKEQNYAVSDNIVHAALAAANFEDAINDNYHLTPASRARNSAEESKLQLDFDGHVRANENICDQGAYEYFAASPRKIPPPLLHVGKIAKY